MGLGHYIIFSRIPEIKGFTGQPMAREHQARLCLKRVEQTVFQQIKIYIIKHIFSKTNREADFLKPIFLKINKNVDF